MDLKKKRSLFYFFLALTSTSICPSHAAFAEDIYDIPDDMRGDGTVTLYRPDKDMEETFTYRDIDDEVDELALADIAYFFRCRLTDETHDIDVRLIEILDAVEDHFDAERVVVISGYRSPERNAITAKKGRRVAKDSMHMYGKAADIVIAGVPSYKLRDFAYSLHQGGIGYYGKRFVHVDAGPERTWGFTPSVRARTKPASAQQ